MEELLGCFGERPFSEFFSAFSARREIGMKAP